MALDRAAAAGAKLARAQPAGTRWFLACDTDADGVCAAAVTARALRRIGHRVQVRASRDKTEPAYREILACDADAWVFLDKGTSHLGLLAHHARPDRVVLVLDHHNLPDPRPEADGLVLVNPRAEGMDGSRDASSSTTAAAFAQAVDPANVDAAGIALAGAIGDWQHRGGWRGYNAQLVDQGLQERVLERRMLPALVGATLASALAHHEPPLAGLHGDAAACAQALRGLDLDPDAEAEELDRQEQTRLVSWMALRHLADGHDVRPDALVDATLHDRRLGMSLRHVFRMVDACGRNGRAGLGVAFLLGDDGARQEAQATFRTYKASLRRALEHLESHGTERRPACQVAWTREAAYTGMVAGLGMSHVLDDRRVPVVVLASREDDQVQVSTRGSHDQVAAGLDLGAAVQEAAAEAGAEGGGHPIAAGAVLAADRVDRFLDDLDRVLQGQGFVASDEAGAADPDVGEPGPPDADGLGPGEPEAGT